jgi:hypothetical protein
LFSLVSQTRKKRMSCAEMMLRITAYGETTWQRLIGATPSSMFGGEMNNDELVISSKLLGSLYLSSLASKVERNEMRITISPGTVRLKVHSTSWLEECDLQELNTKVFAWACELTSSETWMQAIDGINFFAWRGEAVPKCTSLWRESVSASKQAVFFSFNGPCVHESGVSVAKVVCRALTAANVGTAMAWFISSDDAFYPECEVEDVPSRAPVEREISEASQLLKSTMVPLDACPQAARIKERCALARVRTPTTVMRTVPRDDRHAVLLVLWRQLSTKKAARALDIVRQVVARHPRNDLTPIARRSQLWWPARGFVDDAPDDVLHMDVSGDSTLNQAEQFAVLLARARDFKHLQVLNVSGCGLSGAQLCAILDELKRLRLLIALDTDDAALEQAAQHPRFAATCAWTRDLANVFDEYAANHHRMMAYLMQLRLTMSAEKFHGKVNFCDE